ncbi:MAG: winged helix-turn-helix domain-containing protein [Spirosomaceae bacterium]|jgi:DNA-binding winged helix-turn-helix (wHTH) protein|nr:winged helix-turn-helix domain-containing protein [Spirosomataceae bacterium]
MIKLVGIGTIALLTAWFGLSVFSPVEPSQAAQFDQKTNLALRRTGHWLLKLAGDSTSQIPVVKKLDERTFVLQLSRPLLYDSLPSVLQASLALHQLPTQYDVAVLNCQTGDLELGYNAMDFLYHNEVPCGGRHQNLACYQVKVTFADIPAPPISFPVQWTLVAVLGVLGIGYGIWKYKTPSTAVAESEDATPVVSQKINFGRSSLELSNLTLRVGEGTHTLTYREAKLLQLFVKHPNQVLERDFILQSVWGEEGVTVGRSVDVFVSRLRKLLQADATLKIVAVHGVGYRFEIQVEVLE